MTTDTLPRLSPATWDVLAQLEREKHDGGKSISKDYVLEHAVLLNMGFIIEAGQKAMITVRGETALRELRFHRSGKVR